MARHGGSIAGSGVRTAVITAIAVVAFAGSVISGLTLADIDIKLAAMVSTVATIILLACTIMMRKGDRYRLLRHGGDMDLETIEHSLPEGDELHPFAMEGTGQGERRMAGYVTNHSVDRMLVLTPYRTDLCERYLIPDAIAEYVPLLSAGADGQSREMIALVGDMTPMMLATGRKIPLAVATPTDQEATDGSFDKVIATAGIRGAVLFDGCSLSLSDDGSLLPVSQTGNANVITIHMLAMTSDGYLALMRRDSGRSDILPTVSCPLLPESVTPERSLQDAVTHSVHLTFSSAYGIPEHVAMGSSVIGMARILERNGAPDIYVLTRVDMPMGELAAAGVRAGMTPASETATPWLAGTDAPAEIADTLSRVAYTLLDTISGEMSIDTAGLIGAVFETFGDGKMMHRVFQRLGMERRPKETQGMVVDSVQDVVRSQIRRNEKSEAARSGASALGSSGRMSYNADDIVKMVRQRQQAGDNDATPEHGDGTETDAPGTEPEGDIDSD